MPNRKRHGQSKRQPPAPDAVGKSGPQPGVEARSHPVPAQLAQEGSKGRQLSSESAQDHQLQALRTPVGGVSRPAAGSTVTDEPIESPPVTEPVAGCPTIAGAGISDSSPLVLQPSSSGQAPADKQPAVSHAAAPAGDSIASAAAVESPSAQPAAPVATAKTHSTVARAMGSASQPAGSNKKHLAAAGSGVQSAPEPERGHQQEPEADFQGDASITGCVPAVTDVAAASPAQQPDSPHTPETHHPESPASQQDSAGDSQQHSGSPGGSAQACTDAKPSAEPSSSASDGREPNEGHKPVQAGEAPQIAPLHDSGLTYQNGPLAAAGLAPSSRRQQEPGHATEEVFSLRSQLNATRAQLQAALQDMHTMRTNLAFAMPRSAASAVPSPFQDTNSAAAMPLWKPALDGFKRGFVLAYGVRAGIGVVARALQLWRARQCSALGGWGLLSEKGLVYREDAVRLGLFVGGFTGLYHLLHELLAARFGTVENEGRICFLAGTIAGLTLVFQRGGRRRTLALYMAARLAQCWYNSLKARGRWHFWGSDWAYGDALLFALSSAQVMYAYVMRPETLPESYWRFIVRSGPVDAKILEAVRANNRRLPVDIAAVNAYVKKHAGGTFLTTAFPRQIPAAIIHPWTTSAVRNFGKVTFDTFRKTFPLYMSLSIVPYVVLNLKRAAKAPVTTAVHAVLGALRSTSFLASFVGLYQGTIDMHRKLFAGDHKLVYYVAGLVASSAVLIEKRARRAELALYTLPRAVDSFFIMLMKRQWMPAMPFGEVALFALCMGGLMYYREHEPATMAPFLNTLISRIVFGQTKRDRPAMPRPSSIYFSHSDLPGGFGVESSPQALAHHPDDACARSPGAGAAGPDTGSTLSNSHQHDPHAVPGDPAVRHVEHMGNASGHCDALHPTASACPADHPIAGLPGSAQSPAQLGGRQEVTAGEAAGAAERAGHAQRGVHDMLGEGLLGDASLGDLQQEASVLSEAADVAAQNPA